MNKKLQTLALLVTIGLTSLAQAVQYGTVSNAVQPSSGCLMVSGAAPSKIPASAVFGGHEANVQGRFRQIHETTNEQHSQSPLSVSAGWIASAFAIDSTVQFKRVKSSQKIEKGILKAQLNKPKKSSNFMTTPQPVSNLDAKFLNGSLEGEVSFIMPEKCVDGRSIPTTQQLLATICVRRVTDDTYTVVETRNGFAGDTLVIPLEMPMTSYYTFEVYVQGFYNESILKSEKRIVRLHIGEHYPVLKNQVRLSKVKGENSLCLSWELEPDSSHLTSSYTTYQLDNGWWYNPDDVSVDIYRNGELISEKYKGTYYVDQIESDTLTGFQYSVDVYYKNELRLNRNSNMNISNVVALGPARRLPFNYSRAEYSLWSIYHPTEYYSFLYNYFAAGDNNFQLSLPSDKFVSGVWAYTPPALYRKGVYKVTYSSRYINNKQGSVRMPNPIYSFYSTEPIPTETTRQLTAQQLTAQVQYPDKYESYFVIDNEETGYCSFHILPINGVEDFTMDVKDFKIEPYTPLMAPDSVSSLLVVQASPGSSSIVLSFCVPTKDISGAPLNSITRVDIFRNDNDLIASFDNPNLQSEIVFTDTAPQKGFNTYKIIAYNDAGAGMPNFAKTYAGLDQPVQCEGVFLDYKNGKMELSWEPVTRGENGYPIGDIVYSVMAINEFGQYDILCDTITRTKYTFDFNPDEGDARQIICYVIPKNADGIVANYWIGNWNYVIVGEKKNLPIYESFDKGALNDLWMTTANSTFYWGWRLLNDIDVQDNGVLRCSGHAGEPLGLFSQNLDLSKAKNPTLSFWVKHESGPGELEPYLVKNYVMSDENNVSIGTPINSASLGNNDWNYVEIPLGEVSTNTVYIAFEVIGAIGYDSKFYLDNIHVWDKYSNDLELKVTSSPAFIEVENTRKIEFQLSNFGNDKVKSNQYKLNVYRNDEYYMSLPNVDLEPNQTESFEIAIMGQRIDNDLSFRIVAEWDNDENQENNSATVTIQIQQPKIPVPVNLSGEEVSGRSHLSWEIPSLQGTYDKVRRDGAEGYGDYNFGGITKTNHEGSLGDWTVFNGNTDDLVCWMPTGNTYMAWASINPAVAFDQNYQGSQWLDFTPHGGTNIFYSNTVEFDDWGDAFDTNHWLVTPTLNGKEQTIKFWAKTNYIGLEGFDQLMAYGYTTSRSLANAYFECKQITIRHSDWKEYNFDVPEGTTYVCFIHQTNPFYDNYSHCGLCLDDIEFTVEADASELEVRDYTVYRDNKVIATGVTDTHYVDAVPKPGVYRYRVSANYAEAGESALSNEVELFIINTPGPDDPNSALGDLAADGTIVVRPVEGGVQVRNASGEVLSVYNVAGQLIGRVVAHSDLETIALSPGMYLVTAGNKVGKVLVR